VLLGIFVCYSLKYLIYIATLSKVIYLSFFISKNWVMNLIFIAKGKSVDKSIRIAC